MSLPITIAVTEKVTGSEGLWAEHGLTGLVIFALFGLLITIIGLFVRTLVKKDEAHTKFIETMLKEERTHRDEERKERKETRAEHSKNSERLACAIDGLTCELRREHPAIVRDVDPRMTPAPPTKPGDAIPGQA